jgi:hypothetical protein
LPRFLYEMVGPAERRSETRQVKAFLCTGTAKDGKDAEHLPRDAGLEISAPSWAQ